MTFSGPIKLLVTSYGSFVISSGSSHSLCSALWLSVALLWLLITTSEAHVVVLVLLRRYAVSNGSLRHPVVTCMYLWLSVPHHWLSVPCCDASTVRAPL